MHYSEGGIGSLAKILSPTLAFCDGENIIGLTRGHFRKCYSDSDFISDPNHLLSKKQTLLFAVLACSLVIVFIVVAILLGKYLRTSTGWKTLLQSADNVLTSERNLIADDDEQDALPTETETL